MRSVQDCFRRGLQKAIGTAPPVEHYVEAANRNLQKLSRTASGVVDTSASKEKAGKMAVGSGSEAANLAQHNFTSTVRDLHAQRNRPFHSDSDVLNFVDGINKSVNQGIVKPGVLHRTDDSTKYPYTPVAKLGAARRQFAKEFKERIDRDHPHETAAWMHWRINHTDHPYADGVGKTAEALSTFVAMRHGAHVHEAPERSEWFKHTNTSVRDPERPGSYYDQEFRDHQDYFKSRYPHDVEKATSSYRLRGAGGTAFSGEPPPAPKTREQFAGAAKPAVAPTAPRPPTVAPVTPSPAVHLSGFGAHVGNAFRAGMARVAAAFAGAGKPEPVQSLDSHMGVIKPIHAIASAGNARHWSSTVQRATKNEMGGAATHSFSHFYTAPTPMKHAEKLQFAYEKAGHQVGEITRSKVRLADGSTRHNYSFSVTHKDGGPTHTINMFRGRSLNAEEKD